MTAGLVVTLGLPASAAGPGTTTPRTATPATSAFASARASGLVLDSALLASPTSLRAAAPVTAPATAAVSFDAVGFTATPTPPPAARVTARASRTSARAALTARGGSGVLAIARQYFGIRYRYGGTTPSGFDCSGYTGYVFRKAGIKLPRTAHAQMGATRRISRSQARPGDLVFFVSGGHAYHVGIYVGGNMMFDSPRSGRTIGKHKIWSSSVVFGRP